MGNVYGYVRVSTKDQNEDRQLIALQEMSIPEKNIFVDKQSGKDFKRPMYKRMLRKIKKTRRMTKTISFVSIVPMMQSTMMTIQVVIHLMEEFW